jgi:hypothetical protein
MSWVITGSEKNPVDLFRSQVSLLLHGDGTNGSTTITDSSPTPKTVTANGNAQISTAQSKFGGASIAFDGTGDWAAVTNNETLDGNFTVEFWVNYTTISSASPNRRIFCTNTSGNAANNLQFIIGTSLDGSGILVFSNVIIHPGSPAKNDGQWHHVAVSRASGQSRFFIDGVLQGLAVSNTQSFALNNSLIGTRDQLTGSTNFDGYIDDLRITRGIARYQGSFTPPTAPFPDI